MNGAPSIVEIHSSLVSERAWMVLALCKEHPEVDFHPEDARGVAVALRVCQECPVREDCLDYALAHSEHWGIWGGTSERERRRINRDVRVGRQTLF